MPFVVRVVCFGILTASFTASAMPGRSTQGLNRYRPPRTAIADWQHYRLLDANESPTEPPGISALHLEKNRYPNNGYPFLRKELGRIYHVDSSSITLGHGTLSIIDTATRAANAIARLKNGIVVGVEPAFGWYAESAHRLGKRYVGIPGLFDDNMDKHTKELGRAEIVYVCRPNNAHGRMVSLDQIRTLRAKTRGVIFVDEAYGEFADASREPSAIELVRDGMPHLLVTRTMSKAWGLAGIRVGYGIGDTNVIAALERERDPYVIATPSLDIATWALQNRRLWMGKNVLRMMAQKERLEKGLRSLDIKVTHGSAANFVLFETSPRSTADLANDLRSQHNILVRAFADKWLPHHIRVSASTTDDTDAFLAAMTELAPRYFK